jgi:hypothetical protein
MLHHHPGARRASSYCAAFVAAFTSLICAAAALAAPLNMAVRGTPDSVRPGGTISLAVTVANSGSTTMNVARPTFVVPTYTSANSTSAGNTFYMGSGDITLLAGESYTFLAEVLVLDTNPGTGTPTPDGSVLTFNISASSTNPTASASASTNVVVSTDPNLALHVTASDDASALAANSPLSYTLTYSNPSSSEVQGALLKFTVPAGCTFVTADGGDSSFANSTVTWNVGTVAAGGSGVRHVTVQVGSGFATGALFTSDSSFTAGQLSARCRTINAVKPGARLSLSVVTAESSVKPGGMFRAIINVINRGSTSLSQVEVGYNLPGYTSLRNSHIPVTFLHLAPGESTAVLVAFRVQQDDPGNGLFAPPDGTMIHLDAYAKDGTVPVGALADCNILVRSTPLLELDVNASDEANSETAAGATTFTYDFGNPSATDIALGKLSARVPAGCTFVSADGAGVHSNGMVTWDLASIPAGTIGRRHMTVSVGAGLTKSQLQAEATLSADDAAEATVHAHHSVLLHTTAPLTLTVTATPELVKPGNVANVHLTIGNRGNVTTNSLQVEFITPAHTKYSDFYDPGYNLTLSGNALPAGEIRTIGFSLPITNGNPAVNEPAPTQGEFLPLVVRITEQTTGLTAVAKVNLVVDQPQDVVLDLTASDAAEHTAPGDAIEFTATYGNPGGALAAGGELVCKLPDGVTFATADGGVSLGADGLLHFPIEPAGVGGTGRRTIQATIDAGVKSGTQLLAEAFLTTSDKAAQAHAHKAVSVRTTPQISLTVTAVPNPALPGETVQVKFDVTNHGLNTISSLYVACQVPNFVTADGGVYDTGDEATKYLLTNLAPDQTQSIILTFAVLTTDPGAGTVGPAGGMLLQVMAYAYNYSTYDTAVATTNIAVRGAITASPDFVLLRGLGPVAIQVLKNDKAAVGKLTVSNFTQAAHGSLVLNKRTGTFTYRADASFTGRDFFTYTVTNGSVSATAIVTISNPFLYFVGTYRLDVVDGSGNSVGFVTVKMSNGGVFTGKLYDKGTLVTAVRGSLDGSGNFTGVFKPKGKPAITLKLSVSKPGSFAQIRGSVQYGTATALNLPTSAVIAGLPAGYATGEYNVLFDDTTIGGPEGMGWAGLVLGADGKITLTGRLGDDQPLKTISNLEADGSFTIYQQLYGTKGALSGRLSLSSSTGAVAGTLNWIKAPKATPATQFPLGFGVALAVTGSPYAVVAQGGADFDYPTIGTRIVTVEINDGSGSVSLGTATESAANDSFTPTAPNAAQLVLTIARASGAVSGSFTDPATSKKLTFTGLVNQDANIAAGVYKTGDHSGSIIITPQ